MSRKQANAELDKFYKQIRSTYGFLDEEEVNKKIEKAKGKKPKANLHMCPDNSCCNCRFQKKKAFRTQRVCLSYGRVPIDIEVAKKKLASPDNEEHCTRWTRTSQLALLVKTAILSFPKNLAKMRESRQASYRDMKDSIIYDIANDCMEATTLSDTDERYDLDELFK